MSIILLPGNSPSVSRTGVRVTRGQQNASEMTISRTGVCACAGSRELSELIWSLFEDFFFFFR